MTSFPKSKYLNKINRFKFRYEEAVTEGHRDARDEVLQAKETGYKRVNLYGASPHDLTLVCWLLAEQPEWAYSFRFNDELGSDTHCVVFDRLRAIQSNERKFRRVFELNNLDFGVMVTEKGAREVEPQVELQERSGTLYLDVTSYLSDN